LSAVALAGKGIPGMALVMKVASTDFELLQESDRRGSLNLKFVRDNF
jgi:hypothetical protein